MFRDGVGDGQLSVSAKYEAEQFKDCFKHISDDYSPGLGFVVVQKRINTRIFLMQGKECENPAPGTVLDHTVTKRDWYDFFLVSQHVGQGTVSLTFLVRFDAGKFFVIRFTTDVSKTLHLVGFNVFLLGESQPLHRDPRL